MKPVYRTAALLLFALGALTMLGCGALRAASARQAHINEQMQNYTYEKSLDQIWPEARALLFEAGYQVRDTGEGSTTLETEWSRSEGGSVVRYLVQGIELDGGKAQVRFNSQAKTKDGSAGGGRDYSMEWRLVQRVEPTRAARIEGDADAAGEAARGD